MKSIRTSLAIVCMLISIALFSVNVLGIFKDIRPNISEADLRFERDFAAPIGETKELLSTLQKAPTEAYLRSVTSLVDNALAHIHWNEEPDPTKFHQRVPIWENFILYFMGLFSGIPEYQKYHFMDYKRSLERGIGLCGDASMVTSQLLDKAGIYNQIIAFPRHVVVAATLPSGKKYILDADYGVFMDISPDDIKDNVNSVVPYYREAGYSAQEAYWITQIYRDNYSAWNGVKHFVTKKYYFEYISYVFKWLIPTLLALVAFYVLVRNPKKYRPVNN